MPSTGLTNRARLVGLALIAFVAFLSMPLGSEGAHAISSVLPPLRSSASEPHVQSGHQRNVSAPDRGASRVLRSRAAYVALEVVLLLAATVSLVIIGRPGRPLRWSVAGLTRPRAPPVVV